MSEPPSRATGSDFEQAPTVVDDGAGRTSAEGLVRGAQLGRFVVLERVGSGGMGVVYAAYDPTLDRKVAVKLLAARGESHARPGLPGVDASRSGRPERAPGGHGGDRTELLREAQAMARLQHPNVAAVHDVGVLGDDVFMAMEYVEGTTLGEYLGRPSSTGRRSWRDVVRLFVETGRGLAAAHAAGLVHRDFKPGNVVVGRDGRPRVLDFGLARAVGARTGAEGSSAGLLDSQQHTRSGLKAGTPAYMSPEQIDGTAASPASDQFSFCVALWDALYDDLPYAGETLDELRESMRRGRLRTPRAGAQVPARIRSLLLRGLAEDPRERHPDLETLLDALAFDPRAKRRRALAWSGAAVAIGVAALGVWLVLAQKRSVCRGAEARLEGIWDEPRRNAVQSAFARSGSAFGAVANARASAALDDFAGRWVSMRTEACEATRVRGEQSEDLLDLRMTCLDARLAELDALADTFTSADAKMVDGAVRAAQGLTPIERCADTAALLAPTRQPAQPAERAKVAAVREQVARAKALGLAGRRSEAIALAEAAVAAPIDFRPARAEALAELGGHYKKTGKPKEAAAALDRALVEAIAARHPLASVDAADGYFWLDLDLTGETERAAFWLDYGRAAASSLGPDTARDLLLEYSEAALRRDRGDLEGALAVLERAQPIAESEAAGRSLLPYILWMRADVLVTLGRFREALPIQERGLAIDERDLGPDHPDVAFDLQVLASIDQARDELGRAESGLRRALAIAGSRPDSDPIRVADLMVALAETLTLAERPHEALEALEEAQTLKETHLGADYADRANILQARGDALRTSGLAAEALASHREALSLRSTELGDDHPDAAQSRGAIGRDLIALDRPGDAVAPLRAAIASLERLGDAIELAWLRFDLARALDRSGGDRAEAARLVDTARQRIAAEDGHPAALGKEIAAWDAAR